MVGVICNTVADAQRLYHQLKSQFLSHFTAYDLDKIRQLKFGSKYVKRIKTKTVIQNVLEVNIIVLRLKTRTYWLARINNVTEEIKKRQELEINEKKYRNLYYRNKAENTVHISTWE